MINITVAGVTFSICCTDTDIKYNFDSAYLSFLQAENHRNNSETPDITIRLESGNIPDTSGMTKVFDSEQSWSMFSDGTNCYLSLNPPSTSEPLWIAKIDGDFTQAVIYCSKKYLIHENGKVFLLNPVSYPLDQILLMNILSKKKGALMHAAGAGIGNMGCVFPGKSGAGKSTLSRRIAACENSNLLSDDRIVVRKTDGGFNAYGTPWPGEAGVSENLSLPVTGFFFLNHAETNGIKSIRPKEALKKFFPIMSIPWHDRERISEMLMFCEDLVHCIPAYELSFKPDIEVKDVLERFFS